MKLQNLIGVLGTVIFLCGVKESCGAVPTDYQRLKENLLNGYDPHSRPVQSVSNQTVVEFTIFLTGFDFNDHTAMMTIDTVTWLRWQDFHMKWDPIQYGNITTMYFAWHQVWQPDITVYNNFGSDIDHFHSSSVIVSYNGIVQWVPPATFYVKCGYQVSFKKWPYDQNTCQLAIGSWSQYADQLLIKPLVRNNESRLDITYWHSQRQWSIDKTKVMVHNTYVPGTNDTVIYHRSVQYDITFSRYSASHTAGVVGPGIAIAISILASFWLRPGTPERMILLLFLLALNSISLFIVYYFVPYNGNDVPLMVLYYRDSLMMISFALAWTVVLRHLAATKRTSPVPLPGFVQSFLGSWISMALCLDPRPNQSTSSVEEGSSDDGKLVGDGGRYQADWAWLAHLLDRVAFGFYLAVYIIFVLAFL